MPPVEPGRPANRSYISNSEGAFDVNGAPFYNDNNQDISEQFNVLRFSGEYTVTAGDATANASTIPTGLTTVSMALVQVVDSGDRVLTSDADITWSAGNIVVADGATYNTTAGYKIRWFASGV